MKKSLMKVISLFSFVWLASVHESKAQESSPCKIAYSYDAAGNRIRREYRCDTPPDPRGETEQPGGTLITGVSPNPSQGSAVVYFSKPVFSGMIELYDISGVCLNRFEIRDNVSFFRVDLSPYAPGTYLITLRLASTVDTYPVIRM